jgi:uncharacterized protein YdhG (YjbR/CyaY superfamily)
MKRASVVAPEEDPKARAGAEAVDAYLAALPEPARTTLGKIRASIRAAAGPEATEVISYKMPAFRYKGILVWYSAFSEHCSFFPGNSKLIEEFAEDLAGYSTAKGTIRFPLDKPLPASLIRKIVRIRMAENESRHPEPGRSASIQQ